MNVICIKPTTKLVKGGVYKVAHFNNQNAKGYAFFRPTIRIYLNDNSLQTFPLQSFKPTVGDTFAQINWICPDYQILLNEREETKIDKNLKPGDYVVPLYDSLKTLIKGRKYRVKDVSIFEQKNSSGAVSWVDIKIKLDGSERFYTSWNFRKCTSQESREIGLNVIFDEENTTEKVNKHKRKFDYYTDDEKKKLLLQFIVTSANDRFRNQLDIIDWAVAKSAKQYKIEKSDFDLVKDVGLFEVLDILK
jgi:hypothetical protein